MLRAIVNGAYLFIVLHVLFLLTVAWQNVIAASLLFAFFLFSCLDSVTLDVVETKPPHHHERLDSGHVDAAFSTSETKSSAGVSGLAAYATPAISVSDGHHRTHDGHGLQKASEEHIAVAIEIGAKRHRHPSPPATDPCSKGCQYDRSPNVSMISSVELYSPAPGGVDDTLIYTLSPLERSNCERRATKIVRAGSHRDDNQAEAMTRGRSVPACPSRIYTQRFYLYPRSEWVFAVAVSSIVTACAAGILLGILYASRADNATLNVPVFPGWAKTPAAKFLLAVAVGIQADRPDSPMFSCCTVVCLSIVSLTSWCLLLGRALGCCRQKSHTVAPRVMMGTQVTNTSAWSRVRTGWHTIRRLLHGVFSSAPYSLVWIGVAGLGQETAIGLLSLSLVMVMVVLLPLRSRDALVQRKQENKARQQRCWSLYMCTLLCLWGSQMIIQLTPVQSSIKTSRLWPGYSRWLVAFGVGSTAPQHIKSYWNVAQAIGLWWAGIEVVYYHAADYVTFPVKHFEKGAVRRQLLLEGIAQRDKQQWVRAINQQRAAHQKLQELQLERESSPPLCRRGGNFQRRRSVTRPQHGELRSKQQLHTQCGTPHMSEHAPFGSSASHCFKQDREYSQRLPLYLASDRGDVHKNDPTLLQGKVFPSKNAHVDMCNTGWPADTVCTSHSHSSSSGCVCLSGRQAPWQCSAISSAHPSLVSGNGESEVVLITATAAVVLSGSTAERLKRHDTQVGQSQNARLRGVRGRSRTPCGVVSNGYEGGKDDQHCGSGAYKNGKHHAHQWSPHRSESLPHSSHVFSAATSGPCVNQSRLHGAVYKNMTISCSAGGSGSLPNEQWPSTAHSVFAGISASDCGSLLDVKTAHRAPSFPREELAHLEGVRADPAPMSLRTASAEGEKRGADIRPYSHPSVRSFCRRVQSTVHKVVRALTAYLQRHTIPLPVEVDIFPGKCSISARINTTQPYRQRNAPQEQEVTDFPELPFALEASPTAAKEVTSMGILADTPSNATNREVAHNVRLWPTLKTCVMQHWSYVCTLLMLIEFAVCGTVVNLFPSFLCIVYALMQRPWPPLWYLRVQVLYSALALLAKGTARVYLLTMEPHVSLTTCRWIGVLLLRIDVLAPSPVVASFTSPSPPTKFSNDLYIYMWIDLLLNGCVVTALSIQWAIVYPDHLFWNPKRELRACGLASAPESRENAGPPSRETNDDERHRDAAKLWSSYKRHVGCWSRHRCGAGSDHYALQLFFDALSLVLFGCAYYAIVPEDTAISEGNLLYAVQQNRLPGIFVASTLALVVVLFLERIIYVLQSIVAKYVLHFLLASAYHALYVLWYTSQNGNRSRRAITSVAATVSVSVLLAAKLASLWCSALQLRTGYALHRLHDVFTIKTDFLHWLANEIFRAVPFLMELRVLLDWSFSATTLKVQHWMLLEDIHHNVYRRYVDIHDLHSSSRHQGRRFPYLVRLYQGVLGFTIILFLLFFPLFWYSTFSPQVRANRVTAWTVEVAFSGMSASPLFSADAATRPSSFHAAITLSPGGAKASANTLLRFAAVTDTWQTMHFAACSTRMWYYTPTALQELAEQLDKGTRAATLRVRSRVTRDRARVSSLTTFDHDESFALSPASRVFLADVLRAWRAGDEANSGDAPEQSRVTYEPLEVTFPFEYSPYVLSTETGVLSFPGARRAHCVLTLHHVGRFIGFSCVQCAEDGPNSTSAATLKADTPTTHSHPPPIASVGAASGKQSPLTFVVASNDVVTVHSSFSLIPSVGLIALYTSFVLVMSCYLRNHFIGDAHRVVLLQLANPEPVAELLQYLYLARSSANNGQTSDLVLEQLLFLELLDLLRSPERLLRLGGRRVDDYKNSTYRQALFDATRRPFAASMQS